MMHVQLKKAALLGLASALWAGSVVAQGFQLQGQRLTVARERDWNEWSLGDLQEPVGESRQDAVEITGAGQVRPNLIRKGVDAVTEAASFAHPIENKQKDFFINTFEKGSVLLARGGIKDAGCNLALAGDAVDRGEDRFETFWGPDLDRPPNEWWLELDLGRLVAAEKIVLRFVEEDLGDPFFQFRVLASRGDFAFGNKQLLNYRIVGGTTRGVREQRLFEYLLEPDDVAVQGFTGMPVQYVRIVVTDSNLDRAEEISRAAHAALPAAQRGAVEYYLKSLDGGVNRASKREFEANPGRQDTVRFYRRERPRLADVEVYTLGDNLGLGILERGGAIEVTGDAATRQVALNAFDGQWGTFWLAPVFAAEGPAATKGGRMTADLGSTFWIDTVRLLPFPEFSNVRAWLHGYVTRVSDGSRASDGTLVWDSISPVEREINASKVLYFEDLFESRPVRFLEVRHLDGTGRYTAVHGEERPFSEIQLFGEGYVSEVTLTSPLIEFKSSNGRSQERNLTRVSWAGETPPGTGIEIRTQTGNELIPEWHFFDSNGKEVTRGQYYRKVAARRGDSTVTYAPGVDWSPWSKAYEHSGDPFLSPSPRRFLKLQARLRSSRPDLFATLDSLTVHLADPLARQLVAEITPRMEVRSVEADTFFLFVRPLFVEQPDASPRFDEIRVMASQRTEMALMGVRLGGREELLAGGELPGDEVEVFGDDGGGTFTNKSGEVLEVRPTGADSIWIKLPRLVEVNANLEPVYHRIAQAGDEAPLNKSGGPLSRYEYTRLPVEEQGRIEYFEVAGMDSSGTTPVSILRLVDKGTYGKLPFASQGPVRYFRQLFEGEEVSLDNDGEPLTRSRYNRLGNRKGAVVREGEVVELRFRSRIFLNGTTFSSEVGNSRIPGSWQRVDPGDATERIDGHGTSVFSRIAQRVLHSLEISSSPFTPNGDDINDRLRVVLSVVNIDVPRSIEARFFTLGGELVAVESTLGRGGEEVLEWDGRSAAGDLVPPGLYLCRIHVDSDSGSDASLVRVVGVAY